jgi:hypothetical protein
MDNIFNTVNNQINVASSDAKERLMSIINEKIHGKNIPEEEILPPKAGYSPDILTVLTEGGITFIRYIKSLGLLREPNLMVLSSKHHYYYDENDFKSVRVLINLKKLNQIKYLDMFLNTLFRILPQDAGFIGYFSDINTLKVNGFQINWILRLLNRLKNFFSSKTEYYLNEKKVSELFKKNGLTMINMIRMNGFIYFYSRISICRQVELNPLQSAG